MAKFLIGLLVYLFPVQVVAKMLVVLLRGLADLTPTKVDDKLVALLEKNLGLTKEEKDERVE